MRSNELSYMSFARTCALVVGATFTLAACGGGDKGNAGDVGDSAGAATAAGGALADSITSGGAGDTAGGAMGATGTMSDANIMSMVGMSNAAEIATSKAVQNKATNANVKAFARDMIQEHQAMQGQADQLATKLNVVPQAPPTADAMQKMVDSATTALNSVSRGADADRQYMTFQVQSHQMTLDNLQRFQTMTQNAQVRSLIEQAIPKVQQHLQRAQDIQGKLGAGSA